MSDGISGRPVERDPIDGGSTSPIELRAFVWVAGLLSSFDRSSFLTTRSARALRSTAPNEVYTVGVVKRFTVRLTTNMAYYRGYYKVYYEVYFRGCYKVYYTGHGKESSLQLAP